jgi:predicted DNA-binding transcriptional regulator YafY
MSTAADQLRRLLTLLPRFAARPEQSLSQLAEELKVPRAQLVADLARLAGRSDESADDDGVMVMIEDDLVVVQADHFRRPMRLTAAELCALELGLGILGRESPADAAPRITALLDKLRRAISDLPRDSVYHGLRDGALAADNVGDVLGTLREALRKARAVRMVYHSPNDGAPTERVVRPWALLFSRGSWYLVGWCERSDGQRVFRCDRIVRAAVTDASARPPAEFRVEDVLVDGRPWVESQPAATLVVRYGPAIARWIAERDGGPVDADGSATRTLPLADREWAIRHVLGYGPDATIVEPEDLRRDLVDRLRLVRGG